ncbi:MAG: NADH-ubiquinone oxidoreductase-F iron-sulfur binding region domain-containing protein [Gammaproteobacteria bacterium]
MDRPLTQNIDPHRGPLDLKGYRAAGGYQAVEKALRQLTPQEITQQVTDAKLRGRGGAGFPAGRKWAGVPTGEDAPHTRYLVVNADEMEPGTFKDRVLLEGDPHQMIEAVIISAYAIQASVAYIFLRGEYTCAAERLRHAITEAYAAGCLGRRLFGTDFSVELHLHMSAGRYICGESSALLNALEGQRAIPRKEVRSATAGLWGKPTVVNNVETLYNVPHIILHGVNWYRGLSRSDDGGTKIYGISGQVKRPGWWDLPMGTTMRELLEEHAGGMRDGYGFRGLLPGGASTEFVLDEHLDTAMDFDSLQAVGSRLGTGTMIVLDDRNCPVGMVHNLERFFAQESCGWCTPCRDGLPWTAALLQGLEQGEGQAGDLELLDMHARQMGPGHTYCMLAPGAAEPLHSALKYFREDFERHIREKGCSYA